MRTTSIHGNTIGLIYMTFGQKAVASAERSYNSLKKIGYDIPAISVGDTPVPGTTFIEWKGKSPWVEGDPAGKFYAGEVKPFLYDLSPFDYSLYIDADTEFERSPMPGFEELKYNDMLLWRAEEPHYLSLSIIKDFDPRLGFSKQAAIDTVEMIGEKKSGIICSGIIFFKKKASVAQLFKDWYQEWLKYKAWDEQTPLVRAIYFHRDDVVVKSLDGRWNSKSMVNHAIIRHAWGTGRARLDDDPHPSMVIPELKNMGDTGIIYISFGKTSAEDAAKSLASIRKQNIDLPAISIGSYPVPGTEFISWRGHTPWVDNPEIHEEFFAGYVKPFIPEYTPFKYNLYLDADTKILDDITLGFQYLRENDVCVTDSRRWYVEQLYTEENADGKDSTAVRNERDYTIKHLNNPHTKLINTGVIFFKAGYATMTLFQNWYKEWQRFALWDEQLAMLRAMYNCSKTVKIIRLPAIWNYHHQNMPTNPPEKIKIFHKWWTARDTEETKVEPITQPLNEVFDNIYVNNFWKSPESRSGRGSELAHTTDIREWLPRLIADYKINSLLDVGCGDFNWMSKIELKVPYYGVDIANSAIKDNILKYGSLNHPPKIFKYADATIDPLPTADLAMCRDILYHLSFENILNTLNNVLQSTQKYILFTNNRKTTENVNIVDGQFRRLNFFNKPFNFPTPIVVFPDCSAAKEEMVMYNVADFQKVIKERKAHVK